MKRIPLFLLLVLPGLPAPAWALSVTEKANPHAHGRDTLGALGAIRGQPIRDHVLVVEAAANEAWTLVVVDLEGVTVTPAAGTGNAEATVRFGGRYDGAAPDGRVEVRDAQGVAAASVAVAFSGWPRVGTSPSRADVAARSSWPNDPDYPESWDLFGFMPDDTSHPGRGINRVDAWEKTPCAPGAGRQAGCTAEHQAGLHSGMAADRAWAHTTGDRSVTLAVLDCGIRWRNRDVVEQVRLNAAELSTCPPVGATAGLPDSYDVNHDGFFNMRDYDFTPVADWNGNGVKDPQDLIHGTLGETACSNGLDDDGNAYVDDVAGWDFLFDDNDPADDTDFGHGDFELRLSVGQGHNGMGGLGVCPTCSALPLRVGDSFIVDVTRYARAVTYAVDNRVAVVQQALGGLGNTTAMHQAVDYAYAAGIPVVAAASDLQSFHHNWPANAEHALMVHAIVFDGSRDLTAGADWTKANTFLNFNNCTNYGAKLTLSAPGVGCSSEATAKTAGQAGLVISRFVELARDNPTDAYFRAPLTTEEIYQVLIASADDIDVPGAEADPAALEALKFPSNEGFEERFGWGRNNAYRAVRVLEEKAIPPEVEITSPRWFEYVRTTDVPTVSVRGRLQNLRTEEDVCFKVRWARGTDPSEAALNEHVLAENCTAAGLQTAREYGTIPMSQLITTVTGRPLDRQDRTITLEIRAWPEGRPSAMGVARKAFFVVDDPLLRPDYPRFLGASGEASIRMVDLDGDEADEVIVATGDGELHAFKANGQEAKGFPVRLTQRLGDCGGPVMGSTAAPALANGGVINAPSPVLSSPAVIRLMPGERPSIVAATTHGALYVFSNDGKLRAGFPVCLSAEDLAGVRGPFMQPDDRRRGEPGFISSPAVHDLDNDGIREIVIGGGDGQLHVWEPDGLPRAGFPLPLIHPDVDRERITHDRIVSSPVLADLDGDGTLEIVVGSNDSDSENSSTSWLFAVRHDGTFFRGVGVNIPPWPALVQKLPIEELLPVIGRGLPTTPAAADLNGDGTDEVLSGSLGLALQIYPESARDPLGDGVFPYSDISFGPLNNTRESVVFTMLSQPTVADLSGDGKLDVMVGMVGAGIVGLAQQGGSRVSYDHVFSAWDIASATFHDGFPAVVEDYQILTGYPVADLDGDGNAEVVVPTAGYTVHAFRKDRSEPEGFPLFTGGFALGTPALGDMDGDGKLDMTLLTRDGYLFAWKLNGPVESIQWAGFKHDNAGTGNIRLSEKDPAVQEDCTCVNLSHAQPPRTSLVLALLLLGWLGRARGGRRGRP